MFPRKNQVMKTKYFTAFFFSVFFISFSSVSFAKGTRDCKCCDSTCYIEKKIQILSKESNKMIEGVIKIAYHIDAEGKYVVDSIDSKDQELLESVKKNITNNFPQPKKDEEMLEYQFDYKLLKV
jgi:hypothetical protein